MKQRRDITRPAATLNLSRERRRVLVVDDQPDVCELLRQALEGQGYEVATETTGRGALERVLGHAHDLVLSDVVMPGIDGITLCREMAGLRPGLPIVLLTGRPDMAMITQALRAGANDFLTKPLEMDALLAAVARILNEPAAGTTPGQHRKARAPAVGLGLTGLLGESDQIQRVRSLILDLGDSTASVLIQGETGTGKENIARALHATSGLRSRPFVAVNCAAMPAGLLESELFGHAKGAFTDAATAKKGLLCEADGGTLLLDEIGDLPLSLQPKLLRAIQERVVRPLGTQHEVPFSCRLISAANQNLELAVQARQFREDLYYRLDVVRIEVPPLRVRGSDILLLAEHFLERFTVGTERVVTISDAARAKLLEYRWPGNVRELENCMERALALTRRDELTVQDLPERIRYCEVRADDPVRASAVQGATSSLFEAERSHVLRTVEEVGGNKTRAAALLGIDRRTLHRRLERYRAQSN